MNKISILGGTAVHLKIRLELSEELCTNHQLIFNIRQFETKLIPHIETGVYQQLI